MPRPVVFFTHAHPVEGSVILSRTGDAVELRVHWPIDRSTDEWFDFAARWSGETFEHRLAELRERGATRLPGHPGGFADLTAVPGAGRIVLHLATSEAYQRDELRLILPADPDDLAP